MPGSGIGNGPASSAALLRVFADPGARLADVERGELDVTELADAFGSNVPPNEIEALFARHPDRLYATASPSLFYAWMNVHEPPFDDVRVRQALNYAVDRELIAELEGGDPLASPACHFVAPGHPGYAPECRYTRSPRRGIWSSPDIERALALVERSRTAGQAVTVSVPDDKARVGRYLTRVLERLGYRSRLRVRGDYGRYHSYAADSDNRAQIGTDGGPRTSRRRPTSQRRSSAPTTGREAPIAPTCPSTATRGSRASSKPHRTRAAPTPTSSGMPPTGASRARRRPRRC